MKFEEPVGATPLDPDELAGLKFKHITTRGELNELEQVNIQEGMRKLSRRRKKDVLTDTFLKTLHKSLFGGVWSWAGGYRRTEKNIGIDPIRISVELRTLIDDARYWVENNTYPPLEAAARFHHRLVQIHPFANGNGRHGRIAADLYLQWHFDHLPVEWTNGFDMQIDNKRRNAYIAALRAADGGEYQLLFEFVGIEN